MKLHILDGGPLTTVQDGGRIGYLQYGITRSGVMDQRAYEQANKLVGNKPDAAVLECTLLGPRIQMEEDGYIAFTGADMPASLDDIPIQRGKTYKVHDGQVLSFQMARSGVRTYLAVAGGIDVPVVMHSRSTNVKIGLGGYEGRRLQAGDVLCSGDKAGRRRIRTITPDTYSEQSYIRVILGPQVDYFTDADRSTFLSVSYKVSPESDRMGIRLAGPALQGKHGMDIVSDGITFGSIQVTSSGQPIILMADHQTTGGYAKIATVVREDLWMLAQARPGTSISFQAVTVEQMQQRGIKRWLGRAV